MLISLYKQVKRQTRHLGKARGHEVNTPSLCTSLIMYMAVQKINHNFKKPIRKKMLISKRNTSIQLLNKPSQRDQDQKDGTRL